MGISFKSFQFDGLTLFLPLDFLRSGPLLFTTARRQGNGTGKLFEIMADFYDFPFFGEAGHGIYRQSFEV